MIPGIFVLVLNYKRPQDTMECLRSVSNSSYENLKVVLIDNHSEDGCVLQARKEFADIHIIENEKNLGYAEGNNCGIRWALAQGAGYVFILNNDTTVERDAIGALVHAGEAEPKAGILAPKILFYDNPEMINSCGTDMDWFHLRPKIGFCGKKNSAFLGTKAESPVFPGSALMIKRKTLEAAGLFDASFFLVHEDADLCYRNLKAGFTNRLVPEAIINHKLSKALSQNPFLSDYYTTRNFFYLAERHANLSQKILVFLGAIIYSLWNALRYFFLQHAAKQKIRGFFRGMADYCLRKAGSFEDVS